MKKVMMKRVTIALVIVCVILAFFAFGFYSHSNEVVDKYNSLVDEYNEVIDDYNRLVQRYNELIEGAATPPYVKIENRTVHMVFKASDGTLHNWTIGAEVLEAQMKLGFYKREFIPELFLPMMENFYNALLPLAAFAGVDLADFQKSLDEVRSLGVQYVNLRDNETGEIHRVIDFRPFIVENTWTIVIPDLYHELGNDDEAFVYEVWYIVTQLTTYSPEVEETPRFPLETMIGGGGDCEDMAILITSMLKAAPADYVVKLVYMDADNPTDAKDVNHVVVWVETPSGYKTFVDGTSHTEMSPFTLVDGWYLEV